MEVHVHGIWISPGHDFKGRHGLGRNEHGVHRVEEAVCHAGKGIVGDRYYNENPGHKKQITFISKEVIDGLQRELNLADVDPSAFRRNVLVSGIDLNSLVGRRFRICSVLFEGVEECSPCYWMDEAVGKGAMDFLAGRGGLRCRILDDGVLVPGAFPFDIERCPQ
jgi:MOSC domain-containing protein YiiM